jgi:hypothetical protein
MWWCYTLKQVRKLGGVSDSLACPTRLSNTLLVQGATFDPRVFRGHYGDLSTVRNTRGADNGTDSVEWSCMGLLYAGQFVTNA